MTSARLNALGGRTFASFRRHRNYRLYMGGLAVSLVGTWAQDTTLPWITYQQTHSPLAVGLLAFCRYLPFTLFGLIAGAFADRFDPRRFLTLIQVLSMCVATTLAVLTLTHSLHLWAIYVLGSLGGAGVVFDYPTRMTLVSELVDRDELPNAFALSSSLNNTARILGPSTAGVLIATVGPGTCFTINAVGFVPYIVALSLLRPAEFFKLKRSQTDSSTVSVLGGIREALGYVRGSAAARLLLTIVAFVTAIGFNFRVVMPILASRTLHQGPGVFGFLLAAVGVGSLVGAIVGAGYARADWRLLLGACGAFSLGCFAIAPVHSVVGAAFLLLVMGASFTLWSSQSQILLILGAPDALRGRLLGIYLLCMGGVAPLGGLFAGWIISFGGTPSYFSVAGAAAAVSVAYGYLRWRSWPSAARLRAEGSVVLIPEEAPAP